MKDLLEQRHKEFEDKFRDCFFEDMIGMPNLAQKNLNEVRAFHDQTALMVLEKVREELEGRGYGAPLDEYVANVKRWDGKNYDIPFDDGQKRTMKVANDLLTSAIEELKK